MSLSHSLCPVFSRDTFVPLKTVNNSAVTWTVSHTSSQLWPFASLFLSLFRYSSDDTFVLPHSVNGQQWVYNTQISAVTWTVSHTSSQPWPLASLFVSISPYFQWYLCTVNGQQWVYYGYRYRRTNRRTSSQPYLQSIANINPVPNITLWGSTTQIPALKPLFKS